MLSDQASTMNESDQASDAPSLIHRAAFRSSETEGSLVWDPRWRNWTQSGIAQVTGVVVSRPVRRILCLGLLANPEVAAIPLGRRLPAGSSGLPGGLGRAGRPPPVWPCSGWGLPSRPGHPGRWCALTAPLHPC